MPSRHPVRVNTPGPYHQTPNMTPTNNELDVTGTIQVTQVDPVASEVLRLLAVACPNFSFAALEQAFADFERLFAGRYPGYRACDTLYHDRQHTLDMCLAMARILVAHDQVAVEFRRYGPQRIELGLITALFHDSGYIRRIHDSSHRNGAEYTRTHVSRSARFLAEYLPKLGKSDEEINVSSRIVHFTGFEIDLDSIYVDDARYLEIGHALGSADLMAQMADRCYLEKCRERLYPEFVLGGIAQLPSPTGEGPIYTSCYDLVRKTPAFAKGECAKRLDGQFGSIHEYVRELFGGEHPYMDSIGKNVAHATAISKSNDFSVLRRIPPETQGTHGFPDLEAYLKGEEQPHPAGHARKSDPEGPYR